MRPRRTGGAAIPGEPRLGSYTSPPATTVSITSRTGFRRQTTSSGKRNQRPGKWKTRSSWGKARAFQSAAQRNFHQGTTQDRDRKDPEIHFARSINRCCSAVTGRGKPRSDRRKHRLWVSKLEKLDFPYLSAIFSLQPALCNRIPSAQFSHSVALDPGANFICPHSSDYSFGRRLSITRG